ncbi:hypothetical protein GCM10009654_57580 [Streptomyces hebeiensis]|uniref:Roadblock/LAMTOR2 domain-containing protein n=1 Tax=Streptomyces hebeiensis TaxID=229486 RepID=A0ABP4FNH6_9ACTN
MSTPRTVRSFPQAAPLLQDMSWILSPLLEIPNVKAGVVLSRDGLILGSSDTVDTTSAEGVAAMTSSVLGAVRTLAKTFGGANERIGDLVASTDGSIYYIAPAGRGGALVLRAGPDVDLQRLAFEVRVQTSKLDEAIDEANQSRTPTEGS